VNTHINLSQKPDPLHLHGGRGAGADRAVARALQPCAPAQRARVPPAGTGGDRCWTALCFAPGRPAAASESDDYCVNGGLNSGGRSVRSDA